MKGLSSEIKVGIFTLGALATLAYMFFILSPDSFDSAPMVKYYTILKDAKGVIKKTQVKTNGVLVGTVTDFNLEKLHTRIDFEVRKDVKIPENSYIEVRTKGILGDVFLEIVREEDKGRYVAPGGLIPLSEESADLQGLLKTVSSIAADIKKISSTLAEVLGTEEGKQSITDIVSNVRQFTEDLRVTMETNKGKITEFIDNVGTVSADLKEIVGDNKENVNDIVKNIKLASSDLKDFSANFKDILDEENKEKIDRIIANLDDSLLEVKDASTNIKSVAKKLDEGQGSLGRLISDDTAIVELEGTLKDIRKVLEPATRLEIEVDYHGEFRNDDTSQHYFNMLFKTRPDKFFLIGFTEGDSDVITRKTTPASTDEDGKTVEVIEEREEKAFKFNLQYARRFYFAQLRFGLFETSGGIASDFYFWDDKIKFSVEAFDWKTTNNDERRVAHFKTYISVLFYNHVYLLAGIDDFTKKNADGSNADLNPFFGAGLTFNDNDLKAIFGTAALVY